MDNLILVINPGSTTTKIAVFKGESELFAETIEHDVTEIDSFESIGAQFDFRKETILKSLSARSFEVSSLSGVIGRGGVGLKPVRSGGYEVNELMVDRLKNKSLVEHASNLGGLIAKAIADKVGLKAYIYDPVATDEMEDIARISGMPDIPRTSAFHALNARATAMKAAAEEGLDFMEASFIVAHLGGGISISAFKGGRAIDICCDDEGPFSPERAGAVPCNKLIDLCYKGGYEYREMKKKLRGNGGVKAYLGTADVRSVAENAGKGDKESQAILDAMSYQIAKSIGSLSTVLEGRVDAVIITGGIAYCQPVVEGIRRRTSFIAPIKVLPGENEMTALAGGANRILNGEESAREYTD